MTKVICSIQPAMLASLLSLSGFRHIPLMLAMPSCSPNSTLWVFALGLSGPVARHDAQCFPYLERFYLNWLNTPKYLFFMHQADIRKDYSDVINLPSSNLTYPVRVCLELKSCDFSLGKMFPVTPGIFILALVTG